MSNPNPIRNNKPFKKGQSGNPNGRPRQLVGQVLYDLKEKGISPVSPDQVKGIYETLINCTIAEITEKAKDEQQSALVRIICKAILSGKGFEVLEKLIDRAHGKPIQKTNIELENNTYKIIVD